MLRGFIGNVIALGNITYAGRVLALSPVAYWPLDERNGATVQSAAGNGRYTRITLANSVAGVPNHGAAPLFAPASSSVANVHRSAIATAMGNMREGTIAVWARMRDASVWGDNATRPAIVIQANSNNIMRLRKPNAPNTLDCQYYANATLASVSAALGATLGATWFHMAMTWSKTANEVKFYINGAQQGSTQAATGTWNGGAPGTMLIGANTITGVPPWDGYLSDAAMWARALTPAEITILATAIPSAETASSGQIAVNAASPLTTPTYDGSGQATHPSVVDYGANWNGSRYWMVMTPLPGGVNTYEQPSILVSADGTTWSVPSGLTNPIESAPGAGYTSDAVLFRENDTTLNCIWRATGTADNPSGDALIVRSSTDGITWGGRTVIHTSATDTLASPKIVKVGATYYLYVADVAGTNIVRRYIASALTGPWSSVTTCTLAEMPADYEPWHLDMTVESGVYRLWLTLVNTTLNLRELRTWTSSDGLAFAAEAVILAPLSGNWDGEYIYKPAPTGSAGSYSLWYGGKSADNAWRIGRTTLTL